MGAKLLCEWWLLSCIPFCSLHCFWFSKNAKLALSPDQWLLCCNNPCTCTYFIPVVECLSWRIDDIRRMGAPAYHASALFFFGLFCCWELSAYTLFRNYLCCSPGEDLLDPEEQCVCNSADLLLFCRKKPSKIITNLC